MAIKPTILVAGDFPLGTGLGNVMEKAIFPLANDYNVHVLGVNYLGDPHSFPNVQAYPAWIGGDMLGFGRIAELVMKVRPDVILLFSDLNVIQGWMVSCLDLAKSIGSQFILYYPVDARFLRKSDMLATKEAFAHATYTQFGKEAFDESARMWEKDESGIQFTSPRVIGHGVDTTEFYPVDRELARSKFKIPGITENTIIVLNNNRNQHRKRIDLTIAAYARAMELNRHHKENLDIRLWLHMSPDGQKGIGWYIPYHFYTEMASRGFSSEEMSNLLIQDDTFDPNNLPDRQMLNYLYNACDIGINTSEAEGWGMCQHEMAACGKVQITPNYASSRELWKDCGYRCVPTMFSGWDKDMGSRRETVVIEDAAYQILDYAREIIKYPEQHREHQEQFRTRALEFKWEDMTAGIRQMITEALNPRSYFKRRKSP